MIAFIYAAGRALRLGAGYADRQKILIELGGKTLLEWHVQRLHEAGLKQLVLVTGYGREAVHATFAGLQSRYGVEIREVVNPHYTEGSALSVHASLPEILAASSRPVLLMDGDVLYPPEFLRRLVNSKSRTALLIDRNFRTADDDPVLVPIRQDRPVEFLKKWEGQADKVGESIGFFKIDPADVPLLAKETARRTVGERRLESYDEIIRALVLAGRFGCEDVTGLPWSEIDFPEDIEYARRHVLPAILAMAGEPVPSVGWQA